MNTKLRELAPAARVKQDVRSRNVVQVWVGILKHCERESMQTWLKKSWPAFGCMIFALGPKWQSKWLAKGDSRNLAQELKSI